MVEGVGGSFHNTNAVSFTRWKDRGRRGVKRLKREWEEVVCSAAVKAIRGWLLKKTPVCVHARPIGVGEQARERGRDRECVFVLGLK